MLLVGVAASILFGAALIFILLSQRIDLRRLGVMESIVTRWDRLIDGVSTVLRGHATIVVVYSVGVWILEVIALASVVRSFGVSLSAAREPDASRCCIVKHIGANGARLCRYLPIGVRTRIPKVRISGSDRNHRGDGGSDLLFWHSHDPWRHCPSLAQQRHGLACRIDTS